MTDILIGNTGTAIILADVTDHSPTVLTGTRTDQIDLTSLANNAYREAAKVDFGASRARDWECRAAFEWSVAPTAGNVVEVFIGFSDSATAGSNNPGGLSGSDGDYTGYGAAATDADEVIGQLIRIGHLTCGNDATTQTGEIGVFTPLLRYGCIVVRNGSGQAFIADAVEMSIHLIPVVDSF